MVRINDPLPIARKIAAEYHECYNDDLVSVILFGSAAGEGFDPRRSDINLLVVLSTMSLSLVEKSVQIQDRWIRKRCPRPLFMDKNYIATSVDTFPIEFLDMKGCYHVLRGEDVLKALNIKPAHLRLQIERELKGKRLHLVREWLEAKQSKRWMAQLVRSAVDAFAPALRALLYLKQCPVPRDRMAIALAVQTACGFEDKPLQSIIEALNTNDSRQIIAAFPGFVEAIRRIIQVVDNLIVEEGA